MHDPDHEVVITGVGLVTSLGCETQRITDELRHGRVHAANRSLPVDVGTYVDFPIAQVVLGGGERRITPHLAFLEENDAAGQRDLAFAMLATELAVADANLSYDRMDNRVGAVQAFEAPGVEATACRLLEMMQAPLTGPPRVYDALAPAFYGMQAFFPVHLLGKAFGLHGFAGSAHNACSSGAYAVELAAREIRQGGAEAMIVCGGEAFETGVRLEWFRRLEVYAMNGVMAPFSPAAGGFYVGEGGAALILESARKAKSRNARVLARYAGGAFAQQSWKQTIPDVRSLRLAAVIGRAMETAKIPARKIDLVIPHGAGSPLSDGYEAACIERAFPPENKDVVAAALKPAIGHLLAASTIAEIGAAILAMDTGFIPPTPGVDPSRWKLGVRPVPAAENRHVGSFMKLSTGFTGHDAAQIFLAP